MSVFQGVNAPRAICLFKDSDRACFLIAVRLSWPQHLQTSRTLERVSDGQRGTALALMGVALLMLSQDLLEQELPQGPGVGTGA